MNREIASEWARRMASGEYEQGRNWLRQSGPGGRIRLCTWGVLCEMAVEAAVIPPPTRLPDEDYWMYQGWAVLPPTTVLEWAGVELDEDGYPAGPVLSVLAAKNDRDKDFAEIASLVRRELVDPGRVLVGASV